MKKQASLALVAAVLLAGVLDGVSHWRAGADERRKNVRGGK